MPLEGYQNDPAATTLTENINNAQTSFDVANGGALPATTDGPFRIRIDDEYLKVTARSGNTLTVVRGDDGSTAASHSNGADVRHVVTKSGLIAVGSHILRTSSYGSRPAAGVHNRLFLPTDAGVISLDDGSAWSNWGPLQRFTAPPFADFSWDNQGDAVATNHGWALTLEKSGDGTASNWRSFIKSVPSAPWTLTVYMDILAVLKNNLNAGLVLRESSTGKLVFFGFHGAGSTSFPVIVANLAANTSSPSTSGDQNYSIYDLPKWWRITDDNTNHLFQVSPDGQRWFTIRSQGRTAHMAGAANQFGFSLRSTNSNTPNRDIALTVYHWSVT
jgi:hypothetical protein